MKEVKDVGKIKDRRIHFGFFSLSLSLSRMQIEDVLSDWWSHDARRSKRWDGHSRYQKISKRYRQTLYSTLGGSNDPFRNQAIFHQSHSTLERKKDMLLPTFPFFLSFFLSKEHTHTKKRKNKHG